MRSILDFTHDEARVYFLKQEHYSSLGLPIYFDFQPLLDEISDRLSGSRLSDFYGSFVDAKRRTRPTKPDKYDGVNYYFLTNKDGRYAWRPFQLIHPAIYVSLVQSITEKDIWEKIVSRFRIFQKNDKISCEGLPLNQL